MFSLSSNLPSTVLINHLLNKMPGNSENESLKPKVILYELFHSREVFPTSPLLSWKPGVVRMALHAQQNYCFGYFPRERGHVITWFTPTLFSPLSIGSYWTESIGKKGPLALSFSIRLWIIRVGKSGLETFCSHCLYPLATMFPPCYLSCPSDGFKTSVWLCL